MWLSHDDNQSHYVFRSKRSRFDYDYYPQFIHIVENNMVFSLWIELVTSHTEDKLIIVTSFTPDARFIYKRGISDARIKNVKKAKYST